MKIPNVNPLFYISPLHVTERLKEIGEEYDKRVARIYYVILFFSALILGLLFELHYLFICIVMLFYLFSVPQLVFNQKKFRYETNRFNDINSYMSQMSQSFIYTKDVIKSLEETARCFSNGRMKDTLNTALEMIEEGKWDIKRVEKSALEYIEGRYACEKVRNLHRYFLNVETLGGECRQEFRILETTRTAWQGVVETIRVRRFWERNVGALMYAFFLMVCVLMLHIMRGSDLDIMRMMLTQIVDLVLLLGFIIYFVFMDNRLNKSLLLDAELMNEEKSNQYFEYLENYDSRSERRKYMSFAILSLALSSVLIYYKPTTVTIVLALCLIFLSFNIHVIVHADAIHTIRVEIGKAFPRWLFDVMLLLQRESVEGAIEKSYETAAPVLKRDLRRIIEMFSIKPHDPDAYMSFLKEFNLQSVDEIMHKLYSLAVGANRNSEILEVVVEKSIKTLEKSERDSLMFKDSVTSFTWVPFLCAGFGCICYLVIAIMTSINGIIELIR